MSKSLNSAINKLIKWSTKDYLDLPWRKKRTLYKTLVSEIMLQQTTVQTVLNKFDQFIEEFPNLEALAKASEEQLLVAWKGLGYYRRARNLKKAAESIYRDHNGKIPSKFEDLVTIPGIGDYTANAIIAIGRDKPALALDANLERVISRLYGIKGKKGPKLHKAIQEQFDSGLIFSNFKGSFRELNEALMDLGRNHCQLRKTNCELCPLSKECVALSQNKVLNYPVADQKNKVKKESLDLYRLVIRKGNKVLAYKKAKGQWLEGQYELPTLIKSTTDKKLDQYPKATKEYETQASYKTLITKYKITNHIVVLNKETKLPFKTKWVDLDFDQFSTASIKAIQKL